MAVLTPPGAGCGNPALGNAMLKPFEGVCMGIIVAWGFHRAAGVANGNMCDSPAAPAFMAGNGRPAPRLEYNAAVAACVVIMDVGSGDGRIMCAPNCEEINIGMLPPIEWRCARAGDVAVDGAGSSTPAAAPVASLAQRRLYDKKAPARCAAAAATSGSSPAALRFRVTGYAMPSAYTHSVDDADSRE